MKDSDEEKRQVPLAPIPSYPKTSGQPSRKAPVKPILIAAAVVCGVLAVVFATGAVMSGGEDWLDPNAEQGRYEGWNEKQVLSDLDSQVEEGMMAVSISSSIAFEDGQAEGEARIENIAGNRVDQKITITLDDSGEEVYASGALSPGTHVQNIKLSRDLEPGDYAATAMFTGYDPETHDEKGSAGVQVTLRVLN